MSYKSTDPCIQKAHEDELLFVLMARDPTAPEVVMEWVRRNITLQPVEKLAEAIKCAQNMHNTQRMHYKRSHRPGTDEKTCGECNGRGFFLMAGRTSGFTICTDCKGYGWILGPSSNEH